MLDVCHQLPCELSADSDAAQRDINQQKVQFVGGVIQKKNFNGADLLHNFFENDTFESVILESIKIIRC